MDVKNKEELLELIDDFIREIEDHSGYKTICTIIENPFIQFLSGITGYQPGYFGKPIDNGSYVKFDVDKVKRVRKWLENEIVMGNEKL